MALTPRGIPTPPMPVMPPEGIAPVTDPASTGTAPDASPTTMVLQYLKSRGYQPSSENVRRALEANQRDPGVIPGLRSDRPATDAEDMAAMRAAGAGRGGGGRSLPVPPIPPNTTGATPPMDRRDDTSSAQPSTNTSDSSSSSTPPLNPDYSMPGWGTAAAGTGVALANAILGRSRGAEFVGNAQPASGRVTDVDLPPTSALPSPSLMDMAMNRAVPGPVAAPQLPPPPAQITGPPAVAEAPVAAPGSTVVTPPPSTNAQFVRAGAPPPLTQAEAAALAARTKTMPTLRAVGNAARVIPR
jgi:hypothetical protein